MYVVGLVRPTLGPELDPNRHGPTSAYYSKAHFVATPPGGASMIALH